MREDGNQAAARKRSIIFHYELCCGLSSKPLWPRLKRKKVKKQEKSFSASSGRFFPFLSFCLLERRRAHSCSRESLPLFFSIHSFSLRRSPFQAICRGLPSGSRLPQGRPCSAWTTRRSPRTSSGCFGCVKEREVEIFSRKQDVFFFGGGGLHVFPSLSPLLSPRARVASANCRCLPFERGVLLLRARGRSGGSRAWALARRGERFSLCLLAKRQREARKFRPWPFLLSAARDFPGAPLRSADPPIASPATRMVASQIGERG